MASTVLNTIQYNDIVGDIWLYGDGSDGNVTLTSGNTTLTRDMYYDNLTINVGATLRTGEGYRVFVRNLLTLNGVIATRVSSQASGGSGGDAVFGGMVGGGSSGASLGSPPSVDWLGGYSAVSGAGGNQITPAISGTAGASHPTVDANNTTIRTVLGSLRPVLWSGSLIGGGVGGGAGAGAGGGGGGAGAGVVVVVAAKIVGSGSIEAKGASGANGTGSGAGGGGGAGGLIVVINRTDTIGTIVSGIGTMTNGITVNVAGGVGGTASDGNYTNGSDGGVGYIQVHTTII